MEKDYLDLEGLGAVSEKVNAKEPQIFKGTAAEWEALTAAEQAKYNVKMITDDETGATVDAVTDGDMRAVTSNAVYDQTVLETTGTISIEAGKATNVSSITMLRRAKIGNYVLLVLRIKMNSTGTFEVNNISLSNYISTGIAQWGQWVSSTGTTENGDFYSIGSNNSNLYVYGTKNSSQSSLDWFVLGIEA